MKLMSLPLTVLPVGVRSVSNACMLKFLCSTRRNRAETVRSPKLPT